MLYAYVTGLVCGFGLILAIGSQNSFVLRQGIRGQHVAIICFICAASDVILICAGVAGFGTVLNRVQWLEKILSYAGIAFLIWFGCKSFLSAMKNEYSSMKSVPASQSLRQAILICLAFTWLNPHVYIDTVVFMGSMATQFRDNSAYFAAGACSASFIFFYALGYGARYWKKYFESEMVWRLLDISIGSIMWIAALKLLMNMQQT